MKTHREALFIINTLKSKGYEVYFAGGWPRDYLLGVDSDDIDIATNAKPEDIKKLFKKTIPVGIAFGIIIVVIDNKQFEVASFRKESDYLDGRHPSFIEYTDAKSDAQRRDFTINGMFYDPTNEKIIDYINGKEDLEKKIIKAIGSPINRFTEDKLRMIRAIRFAVRFDFEIEKETKKAIKKLSNTLFPAVSIERVYQELIKMTYHDFKKALCMLYEFHLLQVIFPSLDKFPINSIEKVNNFPKNTAPISKIMLLFEDFPLEEKIGVCKYLKTSNEDIAFIILLEKVKDLILKKNSNLVDWAYLLAEDKIDICIQITSLYFPESKRSHFFKEIEEKRQNLQKAIFRIKSNDPVVKAKDLINIGIKPGKEMGILLKKAEMLAINENIEDPQTIISKLIKP